MEEYDNVTPNPRVVYLNHSCVNQESLVRVSTETSDWRKIQNFESTLYLGEKNSKKYQWQATYKVTSRVGHLFKM